jgi:YebC/PmpR family DNA-binding regulatory protein
MFTKLGKTIAIAAREGGGDMESNFSLRLAVDKARQVNMPMNNIERAIKKGTGDLEGETLEKAVYGGYGPGGVAIAVDTLTDNKNRTVSDLRKIFDEHGGNLAEASSVLWQFKEKGRIILKCAKMEAAEKFGKGEVESPVKADEVMMEMMDYEGVEDVSEYKNEDEPEKKFCEVITDVKHFSSIRKSIEEKKYILSESELIKIPDNIIEISEQDSAKLLILMESLDDHDDVENVWVNADI